MGENLKAKVFRGGAWLGSGSLAEQVSRFGRNMLLARLLAPEAFGTMAIVLSASSLIDTLTAIGVREAIIQNPRGGEDKYLNAAWWLGFGRAISLYSLIFALAPWVSRFYANPELVALLRVSLLSLLFYGAISPGTHLAIKQMRFPRWAAINHGGGICGVVITVILALFIRNVWALVIGYCAESAARCVLSYLLCPYLPSLAWDREALGKLLRFSKGMFGLSFLNLIFARADIFVLAKLYSATDLGLYAMAVFLVQTPMSFIMNLLGQTLLPTFSQIQGDTARINRILVNVTSLIVRLGMPALVFVFFCGHSLLTVVYGDRYGAATGALIIASCVALVNLVNGQITSVLYAKGLPQLHRRCVAMMAITIIVLIYPLAKDLGLVGAQVACLISIVVGYLFQVVRIRQLTGLNLTQYSKSFLFSAAISIGVLAICLGTQPVGILARPVPNIVLGILGCILAYSLSLGIYLRNNQARTT
jgi:O-antigen/teichoic acid export membrane protein